MYIDAKKTLADGRKLPTKQCVEYPTMQEMKEVIEHLGYEAAYEEKAYPRDLTQFGRFRVLLKDPQTGEPKVEGIESRRQLLMKLAELIPGLKSRKEGKPPKPGIPGLALPGYAETLMPAAAAAAPPFTLEVSSFTADEALEAARMTAAAAPQLGAPGGGAGSGAADTGGSSKKKAKGKEKPEKPPRGPPGMPGMPNMQQLQAMAQAHGMSPQQMMQQIQMMQQQGMMG